MDFPPYVRKRIDMIVSSIFDGKNFSSKLWALMSESTLSRETIFKAFTYLFTQIITINKGNRQELLEIVFKEVKVSGFMLDALLTALYESNTKSEVNIWTRWVNDEFSWFDWSNISDPYVLSLDAPSGKWFDFIIYNTVYSHSQPEKIAESQYVNIDNEYILNKISAEACSNFVCASMINSINNNKSIPDCIFKNPNLFNALLITKNTEIITEAMKISFQNNEKILELVLEAWKTTKEENAARFIVYVVCPNSEAFEEETLSQMINSVSFTEDSTVDANILVANEKCMSVAQPLLIADLCSLDINSDELLRYSTDLLQSASPEELISALLNAKEAAIPNALKIIESILMTQKVSMSALEAEVTFGLMYNTDVTCRILDSLIRNSEVAPLIASEGILSAIVDLVPTNQEMALNILLNATLNCECAEFWIKTDACAVLVDEVITKQERGVMVDNFFEQIADKGDENTIIALLPTIATCSNLLEYYTEVIYQRFDSNQPVCKELETLSA